MWIVYDVFEQCHGEWMINDIYSLNQTCSDIYCFHRETTAYSIMTALSAPESLRGENIISVVVLVVSIISALGAAWMILSFTVGYSLMCKSLYTGRIISLISGCILAYPVTTHISASVNSGFAFCCTKNFKYSRFWTFDRPRHKRLCDGVEFYAVGVYESFWQKDLVRASEEFLFLQWLHDASFCDTKYIFQLSHSSIELLTLMFADLLMLWFSGLLDSQHCNLHI